MDAFILALNGALGINTLWTIFLIVVPYVTISVLFGLGMVLIDYVKNQINKLNFEKKYGMKHSDFMKF